MYNVIYCSSQYTSCDISLREINHWIYRHLVYCHCDTSTDISPPLRYILSVYRWLSWWSLLPVQYSTLQYYSHSTVQYSAVQYSTVLSYIQSVFRCWSVYAQWIDCSLTHDCAFLYCTVQCLTVLYCTVSHTVQYFVSLHSGLKSLKTDIDIYRVSRIIHTFK